VIDPRIRNAIHDAARERGQSSELANKLVSWFNAVASGSEEIHDADAAERRLELIYEEVRLTRSAPEGQSGTAGFVPQSVSDDTSDTHI